MFSTWIWNIQQMRIFFKKWWWFVILAGNISNSICLSPLWGDKVSMLTQTNLWGRFKKSYSITRLTAHFMCDLMSDLVICKHRNVWFALFYFFCLMVSARTFGVMYEHTLSKLANHQIRHQATFKVGCQPGDCIWSL